MRSLVAESRNTQCPSKFFVHSKLPFCATVLDSSLMQFSFTLERKKNHMKSRSKFVGLVVAVLAGVWVQSSSMAAAAGSERSPSAVSSGASVVYLGAVSDSLLTDVSMPALSLMFRGSDKFFIQLYTVLPSVSPLLISGGAAAKAIVSGTLERGFHVGGGFGMGDQGAGFFTNIAALGGAHFEIAKSVLVSFDTGLRLHLQKDKHNFAIGGNYSWLGVGVHYGF